MAPVTRDSRTTNPGTSRASPAGWPGWMSRPCTLRHSTWLTRGEGPNGYLASLTYLPAGKRVTANVTWNGAAEPTCDRLRRGQSSGGEPSGECLGSSGPVASFQYDPAGNMTRRESPRRGQSDLHSNNEGRLRVAEAGATERDLFLRSHRRADARGTIPPGASASGLQKARPTTTSREGTPTKRYVHLSAGGVDSSAG